jgi:hypothetical protein
LYRDSILSLLLISWFNLAQRRKEDVQQRIEFISASLRAQGNTQIHKMLKTIRQLTVKEFCEAYNADTQKFLNQQKKNRLAGGTNDISRKRYYPPKSL